MKSILFSLLFLLIPKIAISQVSESDKLNLSENDKLIYLDSTHLPTKSKDFEYFRVIKDYKLEKESYTILEYSKSGIMRMEATSKNKNGLSIEGEETRYYENGTKKSLINYIKGRVNGKYFEWYKNGSKKSEGEYIENEKKGVAQQKINQFWDANGVQKVIDGNGYFEDKGENELIKGSVKNGYKEGNWEGEFSKNNHKNSYKETYKDGKLISGESFDSNNISYKYTEVEIRPEPKYGMADFYKYIAQNYKIPSSLPKGTKGKIYISFVVDKEGKVIEPKILRDLGYGTGQEAIRVLTDYTDFIPGEQRGKKVRCSYNIPIAIQAPN